MDFGFRFFKVYQNCDTMSSLIFFFNLVFYYHVKTNLWMIMMESRIVVV
jgi:hypothetical protein